MWHLFSGSFEEIIPARKLKNFYPGVAEHKDISKLVLLLSSSVNSLRKVAHEALQDFQKYKTLWTEDRDVKVKVCFCYLWYILGLGCLYLTSGRGPGKCQWPWQEFLSRGQEPVNAQLLTHLIFCSPPNDTRRQLKGMRLRQILFNLHKQLSTDYIPDTFRGWVFESVSHLHRYSVFLVRDPRTHE